jgi:hypothetical protein
MKGHGSIPKVGNGLVQSNAGFNPNHKTDQSIQNSFTPSTNHLKELDARNSGFPVEEHHQTF